MSGLTKAQMEVLHILLMRPNGAPIRSADMKLALATLPGGLVCNQYELHGGAMFAKITGAGRAAFLAGRSLLQSTEGQ